MIAMAMVYAILVTALAAAATMAVERAARMLRRPARFIWLVALVLSASYAAVRATSRRPALPAARASNAAAAPQAPGHGSFSPAPAPPAPWWRVTIHFPTWLGELDRPLELVWLAGSLFWGIVLLGSATRLRRRRDGWRPHVLDGTPVYLSHDVGPALFGLTRYSIVLPAWVADLEPHRRRLIVAHEREHARAADPVTLLAGALVVMVQPWNPAAWLMFRRLRFAVEADCDARVLAGSRDVRTYGELLLDLGERTLAGAMPVAALSEPSSDLERRITLLTPPARSRPVLRSLALVAASALLVFLACEVPHPVRGAKPSGGQLTERDRARRDAGEREVRARSWPADRAIFHVTSVSLELPDPSRPFTILVYADGPARVGVGAAAPTELRDTLRLHTLPALTLDVTEASVHVRLLGRGRMRVEGPVTGGPATYLCGAGSDIVVNRGGSGIGAGPLDNGEWLSPNGCF